MTLLYSVIFFVFGTIFGSFYNVIGTRLPNGLSIIKPRSHCESCNKELKWYNLIPLVSYLIQGGKCSFCKSKISIKYFLYELLTGTIFLISYSIFGFSYELIIALTFFSALIIVIISDMDYMIIPDEVIVITSILLLIEIFLIRGLTSFLTSFGTGIISFLLMWGLKKFGDIVFKKESMGGGDIKLMFLIGLIFNIESAILVIFFSSVIALPYALFTLLTKKDNRVPYGPFISITAIILYMLNLQGFKLIDYINLIS